MSLYRLHPKSLAAIVKINKKVRESDATSIIREKVIKESKELDKFFSRVFIARDDLARIHATIGEGTNTPTYFDDPRKPSTHPQVRKDFCTCSHHQ